MTGAVYEQWWFWFFVGPELVGLAFFALYLVLVLPVLAVRGAFRKWRS